MTMMLFMSPTSRTTKLLRSEGYLCEICEHYNSFSRRRHDLLGLFDVIALKDDKLIGIQITSESNNSARYRKMTDESSHLKAWLRTNNEAWIVTWKKVKHRWRYRKRILVMDERGTIDKILEDWR